MQHAIALVATGPHATPGKAPYTHIVWGDEPDGGYFTTAGIYYNLANRNRQHRHYNWYFSGSRLDAALQTYFLYFKPLPPLPPQWIPLFKTLIHTPDPTRFGFDRPAYIPWSVFALVWMNRPDQASVAPIGPRLPENYLPLVARIPGLLIRRAELPDYHS